LSRLHPISGCDNAARRADVVFVHGLGGDAFGTWRHGKEESTSWPHWLGREFPDVGVWSIEYAASPTKWARFLRWFGLGPRDTGHSMALPTRALEVLDLMVQKGVGQRPILFVCHSLGGLLVKHILRKADDQPVGSGMHQVAANTRAILFLATPHGGAALASLIDAFRTIFGATVSIEDLRAHDAHLLDLYDWYRRNAVKLGIQTKTYYESRGVGGALTIVNPVSAQCGVGDDAVALDEDHLSIAKPRDPEAHVCGAVRALLREHVLVPRSSKPVEPAALRAAPAEQRVIVQVDPVHRDDRRHVPCELPSPAEKHFGRQTELTQLTERLRAGKNSAVVGPAGLGKTALAAEAVRAVVGETEESVAASPFPDGVVLLDLYTYRGRAEPAWNNLANALGGPGFMEKSPARDRAAEACRARRALIIIEGGEEVSDIRELCSVLSPQNRRLLLTRASDQAIPSETVELKEALHPDDAGALLDSLTHGRVTGNVRERVLVLLEGHPLALTWAGNLLARDDDDPARLADDWESDGLPKLSDPTEAEHTLQWLFNRSVHGLDDNARQVLAAAGLLARAPFPLAAMAAALSDQSSSARDALKALVRRGLLQRSAEADHWQFTHVLGYRFARQETGSEGSMRERLARWLVADLEKALDAFDLESARSSGQLLQHAAALLRADDDQRLWIAMGDSLLYDVPDRLTEVGRLDLVKTSITAVADWLSRFPETKIDQPGWTRERSVVLNRQGGVLSNQGDLAGALAAYRESQALRRRLVTSDSSNALWQRDLSVSHERIGDVLRDQGDLAGALAAYRESQAPRRRLAEANPTNALWQRDLSVSHEKIGDVLRDQGDLAGALAAYREALAPTRRLAESDPSNALWQRDLSVSHNKVGDVLRDQGDLAGALAAYREALALRRPLAESDPLNTVWQRDLSVSNNKVGDVLHDQGDLAGALAAHRETLALIQRLTEADPSNALWQRDLGISHERIGNVILDQGDLAGALAVSREALSLRRRLAESDPSNALWQRDLSYSLARMAQILEKQGNAQEALPFADQSLIIDERLSALDPTNATWRKDVAFSRALVARLREQPGSSPQ
jgi:tetratricopeptide (TPR) repeat protein